MKKTVRTSFGFLAVFVLVPFSVLAQSTKSTLDKYQEQREYQPEVSGYHCKGLATANIGHYAEAEQLQRKALQLAQAHLIMPNDVYTFTEISVDIARCLKLQEKYKEALLALDDAATYAQQGKMENVWRDPINFEKGFCYMKLNQCSQAEKAFCAVVDSYESDTSPGHSRALPLFQIIEAEKFLGDCYAKEGKNIPAEMHYKKAIAEPECVTPRNSSSRLPALEAYYDLLTRKGEKSTTEPIAARIKEIKEHPQEFMMPCGNGALQQQMWLNWHPSKE